MKKFILMSVIVLSSVAAHAEAKKEIRILKDISLNAGNYFSHQLHNINPNTGSYCQLLLKNEAKTPITIEAGTILTVQDVHFIDGADSSIPFGNKYVRTRIAMSSENKTLTSKVDCRSNLYYRKATAQNNRVELQEAISAFADLLN